MVMRDTEEPDSGACSAEGGPCRLGRTDPESRREHILSVASEVFAREGYGEASMSTIAAQLGGSKATLYKYFPSKESLFAAVMTGRCHKVLSPLRAITGDGCDDLEDMLSSFGRCFLEAILQPESLQVHRLVHSEGPRFPEVARSFYQSGPDEVYGELARGLQRFADRGLIDCDDVELAAKQFHGMVRSDLHMRVAVGLAPAPERAEIERQVAQAARIFARGLGWRQGAETLRD